MQSNQTNSSKVSMAWILNITFPFFKRTPFSDFCLVSPVSVPKDVFITGKLRNSNHFMDVQYDTYMSSIRYFKEKFVINYCVCIVCL